MQQMSPYGVSSMFQDLIWFSCQTHAEDEKQLCRSWRALSESISLVTLCASQQGFFFFLISLQLLPDKLLSPTVAANSYADCTVK